MQGLRIVRPPSYINTVEYQFLRENERRLAEAKKDNNSDNSENENVWEIPLNVFNKPASGNNNDNSNLSWAEKPPSTPKNKPIILREPRAPPRRTRRITRNIPVAVQNIPVAGQKRGRNNNTTLTRNQYENMQSALKKKKEKLKKLREESIQWNMRKKQPKGRKTRKNRKSRK
jgi:hypothetical protein